MTKTLVILSALLALWGCSERYRYPCQDPDNWELKMCKKPYCSANGTCPEDLRHYEKNNQNGPNGFSRMPQGLPPTNNTNKGDCKC